MAKLLTKSQADLIAPGQAPERKVVTIKALLFCRLVWSLIGKGHLSDIFICVKERVRLDDNE